jgi:hypothetical protein
MRNIEYVPLRGAPEGPGRDEITENVTYCEFLIPSSCGSCRQRMKGFPDVLVNDREETPRLYHLDPERHGRPRGACFEPSLPFAIEACPGVFCCGSPVPLTPPDDSARTCA